MDQRMLVKVCRIIIGPTGRRLPAYHNIQTAFTQGLFADYFCYNPMVSPKTLYKYINATTPYPHFLLRHYGGDRDYRRTLSDMVGIVDACTSIVLLRQIQDEVYTWVMGYLSSEEAKSVCQNYINRDAARCEIAVFLADALHYAIVWNFVAKRSSDQDGQS